MTKDTPTDKRIASASPHVAKARNADVVPVAILDRDVKFSVASDCSRPTAISDRRGPAGPSGTMSTGVEGTAAGATERDDTSPQKSTNDGGCSSPDLHPATTTALSCPRGAHQGSMMMTIAILKRLPRWSPPRRSQHAAKAKGRLSA